jgi:hypothetical protein
MAKESVVGVEGPVRGAGREIAGDRLSRRRCSVPAL